MYLNKSVFIEPMKLVFDLATEQACNPELVADIQKLTLDKSKPHMGLKGTFGLYGSTEWWENIYKHKIPTVNEGGTIEELYYAGMDSERRPNSFRYLRDDREQKMESLRINNPIDIPFFKVGARVEILYLLEELKPAYAGGKPRIFPLVLEMAVSYC